MYLSIRTVDMALVYDAENEPRGKGGFMPYDLIDASKGWLRHESNRFYLDFMMTNGTFAEKAQARAELAICDRKQKYFRQHPNWSVVDVTRGMAALKKQWNK